MSKGMYFYKGEMIFKLLCRNEYHRFINHLYRNPKKSVEEVYEYITTTKRKTGRFGIYKYEGKLVYKLLNEKDYGRFLRFMKKYPDSSVEDAYEIIVKLKDVREHSFNYKYVYQNIPLVRIIEKYKLSSSSCRRYFIKGNFDEFLKIKGVHFKVEDFEDYNLNNPNCIRYGKKK